MTKTGQFLLLGMSVVCGLSAGALAQPGPITIPRVPDTLGPVPGAQPPPSIMPEMSITCNVAGLAAFRNRVHIRCASGACPPGVLCPPGEPNPVSPRIVFYATENVSVPENLAATALTVAAEARRSGQRLRIIYRSSAGENPAGCLALDCRRFVAVTLN